jgi:hypothetical protein
MKEEHECAHNGKGKDCPKHGKEDCDMDVSEAIDAKGAARMDAAKDKKKVDVFAYDRKLQSQGKLKGKKLPPAPKSEGVQFSETELKSFEEIVNSWED